MAGQSQDLTQPRVLIMKSLVRNIAIPIFGVIIILAGIFLLLLAARHFVTLILSLEKELIAAIIAASGTILASVAAIVVSQSRAKRREIEEAQRPNKIAAYKKFMEMMQTVLKKGMDEDDFLKDGVLPKDLQELFLSLQSDMIVWASPGVIKTYEKFKSHARHADILLCVDDILREIRKDLGHKKAGLKRGSLIKLFLRDPEELDRLTEISRNQPTPRRS